MTPQTEPATMVVDTAGLRSLVADLVTEGKVRHVGLSQATVGEVKAARAVVPIVSVQNLFNLTNKSSEDVLRYCEAENLAFIPWFPIASGVLANPGGPVDDIVKQTGATPAQVALAWLRYRPVPVIPIIGARKLSQVEDNIRSLEVTLSPAQIERLEKVTAVSMGFPHDFMALDPVRAILYGGMRDRINA